MKDALSRGVGGKRKQADPIHPEDEAVIWENGIFGMNNAETLQNTVCVFYSCKLFGLRGHDEHHSLECNQFLLGEDNQIYPLQINTVIENKFGNLNLTKYPILPEFFFLYIMTDTLFIYS